MSDTTIQADEPAFGPTGSATIPVSLITGFLGSGKTTLLSKLLRHPGMADTAVIINEFGEIGLDHELVEKIDGETVVMTSGCLCCTVRGDLVQALRTLYFRRVRGEVPKFQRLVIETTGLADPAPILHTLMEDPLLEAYYRLDGVITTVDAVNGALQLDAQFELVKQAAVADRIVVTKTDIAERAKADKLLTRLRRLNPGASLVTAIQGEIEPECCSTPASTTPRPRPSMSRTGCAPRPMPRGAIRTDLATITTMTTAITIIMTTTMNMITIIVMRGRGWTSTATMRASRRPA